MRSRTNRRTMLVAAFGMATAMAIAACTSTTPGSPTPAATGGGSTPGATAGESKAIIKAISGDTQTIDPRLNFQPRASEMVANMYDQLVTYPTLTDANGGLYSDVTKPEGLLAESWEISADGLTVTWHLRKGVKFHSGREMTAEDVKWSWQRAAKIQKGGWFDHKVTALYSDNENDIDTVVTVVDKYTVTMKSQYVTPYRPQVFANAGVTVYDSELMKQHVTADDPWAAEYLKDHDAGSGPFLLEKIEPGVQVVMKRFDDYFRGPAAAPQIVYRVIPSASSRATLLENGEVQFAEELDLNTAKKLAESGKVTIIDYKTTDQLFLMMNTLTGPTADRKVRQAIAMAVPYDDIVKTVYFGYAQSGGGPLPIGTPGYDPNAPFAKYDIEKAKATLAASSQASGFDITLSIDASRPQWEQAALLIQNSLAALNIKVTIDKLAPANYNEQFFANKLPFFIFQGLSWVNEPTYHFLLFWEAGSYGNRIGYANTQVDALLAEAKRSTDDALRNKNFAEVQKLMLEDAPAAWIGQPDLVIATTKGISGYIQRPDQITRFYTMTNQ